MIQTGNQLDVAIEGDGFFQIELPDGTNAFTRDGSFKVNEQGTLMTADGYPLDPGIDVPTDYQQIIFSSDGTVSARVPGSATPTNLGIMALVRFPNPAGLDARLGRNLLLETQASGPPDEGAPGEDGMGMIEQGFIENSNVQVVEEILQLIIAQRAYEANSKIIQASDEMLQLANNVKR